MVCKSRVCSTAGQGLEWLEEEGKQRQTAREERFAILTSVGSFENGKKQHDVDQT